MSALSDLRENTDPAGMYTTEQRLVRLADRVNDAADEVHASQRDLERAWERYEIVRAEYEQVRRTLGLPPFEEGSDA